MPILTLKQLTIRFGGLTAVNAVDCTVERGQIFSIIGPNGAGKTTVFNTITGIYEPSAGTIAIDGRLLRRPFTLRVKLSFAAIGLLTGLALMLLAADVDSLWRATIKRNFMDLNTPFSYSAAGRSLIGYLRGELTVEPRGRRWAVVPADGTRPLTIENDEAEALAERDTLQAVVTDLMKYGPYAELYESAEGTWWVQAGQAGESKSQGPRLPLGKFAGQTLAQRQLDALTQIAASNSQKHWRMALAFCLGIAIGSAGSFAVWHRARRTPEVVALGGVARTFQNIRLFQNMTVLENVLTARDRHFHSSPLAMALHWPAARREEAGNIERARELLDFVGISGHTLSLARNLAYGDQRRLEIARALAAEPKLILLDEPAAGMNPAESAELTTLIGKIRDRGITVLLIEHHMKVVMGISDRVAVLDYGVKIGEGTPQEVRENPEVIKAYLGSEEVT